jgi:hypothetical protein
VKRLQIAFATLPNNNTLMISISNGNDNDNFDTNSSLTKRFNKKRTPSEMLQYMNTSKPEIAVEEFFEFWQFINKIAEINNPVSLLFSYHLTYYLFYLKKIFFFINRY